MKKLLKSMACFATAALVGASAFAAAGWLGAGAIYIDEKVEEGVCNGWFYADSHESTTWCEGGSFGGADLGNLTSLTLGGQVQLWDEGSADWGWGSTAKMYYSIDGGAEQLITLNYYKYQPNNNYFQSGGDPMVTTEVSLAGLEPGVHTLAIYFDDYDSRKTTATYTANFTIPEIKIVTFDGNGEGVQGVPDTLECVVGGVYKQGGIPSPTRTNYRFRGWFTDPDDGEGERIRGYMPVEDAEPMTLWAHWEHMRQTVTFDANDGGAGAELLKSTAKFDCGGEYSGAVFTMKGATWANHKFLGWYTEAEGGDPVLWGDDVTSDTTRTLYAHWRVYRQTVTFDANDGGAGAILVKTTAKFDQGGEYSGAVFSMTAATWTGHKFLGWFPLQKGGERVKWGDTVTSEDSRTLYAHWRAEAAAADITGISISTRAARAARSVITTNTDILTAGADSLNLGGSYGLFSNKTANSDAVYAGNAMKSSQYGNSIQLRSTGGVGIITTASGGKPAKVTVDWHSQTSSGRTLNIYGSDSAYTTASNLFDNATQGTFIGAITNPATSLTITNDFPYIGMRSASSAMYLNSIEIQWTVEEDDPPPAGRSVAIEASAETVHVGAPAVTVKATASGFTGDVEWTWWVNNATNAETSDTLTLSTSAAATYVVNVWASGDNDIVESDSVTIKVLAPHEVVVDAGANGSAEADVDEAYAGDTVTLTVTPADGYTWDTITATAFSDSSDIPVDTDSMTFEMPDDDVYVDVTFKEKPARVEFEKITNLVALTAGEYVITGEGTGDDVGKEFAMLASVDTSGSNPFIKRQETAVEVDGSTLYDPDDSIVWTLAQVDNGWTIANTNVGYVAYLGPNNKNAASATNTVTDKSTWTITASNGLFVVHNVASNRYLKYNGGNPRFACYTSGQKDLAFYKKPSAALTQTVTLDLNYDGADNPFDTFVAVAGEPYKVGGIPSPTRTNYRFRGWFTDPTGGERIRGFTIVPDDPAPTLTLYAHWEHQRQTVTFDANDGGAGAELLKETAKFDQGGEYSGAVFTMKGATWANHKFLGWYDQPEGGTQVQWGDTVTSEDTRKLYAHWRVFRQTVTFDANDGGAGAILVKTTAKFDQGGEYTGAVFSMTAATWDGHKFLGWFPVQKGGDRVKWGDTVTSEDTRTLYAHWRETVASMSISGFAMATRATAPAARSAAGSDTVECTLVFETYAGVDYEVQWTSSLTGEWTVLKRWTATTDGQTPVTVEIPADAATGFFRFVELAWE